VRINITITAPSGDMSNVNSLVQAAISSGQIARQLQSEAGLNINLALVQVTIIGSGVPASVIPASQLLQQPKSSGSSVPLGAVVGGIVGAVAVTAIAAIFVWRVRVSRRRKARWTKDLEVAQTNNLADKQTEASQGSASSDSGASDARKPGGKIAFMPFGVSSNESVDATPHAKHATHGDGFRRNRRAGQANSPGMLPTVISGKPSLPESLMGTGLSDLMASGGTSAPEGPLTLGHPNYDPFLATRPALHRGGSSGSLMRGQSGEGLLKGVSDDYSDQHSDTLTVTPIRHKSSSGHVDAQLWAVNWGDLEITRQIGEGSFGKVYLAKWRETTVAVKVLSNTGMSSSMEEDEAYQAQNNTMLLEGLEKEAGLMASLRHPNVVLYLGVCLNPPCVVTEYCARGSLNDVLKRARQSPALATQLDWGRRLNMVLDAAKGMLYLHGSDPPVIHRDLKSPNLLVDKHWRVKVCDFNLSRVMEEAVVLSSMAASNPRWLAPEILGGQGYTYSSDVYSFGIIMWEFMTWQVPWHECGPWQVVALVTEGAQRPEIPAPEDLPGCKGFPGLDEYVELMKRCWHQVPEERPTFAQAITVLRGLLGSEMRQRANNSPQRANISPQASGSE
jgi:serine/threonine protein kinase